jgi:hypothetical protein
MEIPWRFGTGMLKNYKNVFTRGDSSGLRVLIHGRNDDI